MTKITFVGLWRPSGTVDRGTYALVGALAFVLKNKIDRLVAAYFFHRYWGFLNYWVPLQGVGRITDLRGQDAVFLETMVAVALPFVWLGLTMTMKRLRSAGLPPSLVASFVPFLNLLFFAILCAWPERQAEGFNHRGQGGTQGNANESLLARIVPDSVLGSAAVAVLVTVPLALLMVLVCACWLPTAGDYSLPCRSLWDSPPPCSTDCGDHGA
jgi:hypothetical protein